ncbi:MAG: class I SAM-dependent methyltransferase [Planctomycetota bacterium]|jgi:SAM-dependent methyltransferase
MAEFDAVEFKETTRQQWDQAAEAWHRWGPLLQTWLGPATERMLDLAGVEPGSRVLDVAAGAGEQTITAARRVGPQGSVLATDLSPGILEFAARSAAEAGLSNVETQVLDGEASHELQADSFDAVISRVALVYFPDQLRALEGMRHALKPGGRNAALVYSTADTNAFFSIPVQIIRRRAKLPPPAPGRPGPFSLGDPGRLEQLFAEAGFRDVGAETVAAPVHLPTAAECVRFEKESFGALHQMMAGLSADEQVETWQEIEETLGQFETDGGFVGPCEIVIGFGTK